MGNIDPWYAFISPQRDYDIRLSSITAKAAALFRI